MVERDQTGMETGLIGAAPFFRTSFGAKAGRQDFTQEKRSIRFEHKKGA